MANVTGTLFGIGIGPGDPELLTLKAVNILSRCPVVAYIQNPQGHSLARSIAADYIRQDQQALPIVLQMSKDRTAINHAYDQAAKIIAETLATGDDVAMLCEGDPLFFGSFNYLLERLKGQANIQVVPGITSVQAVAAASNGPLIMLDQTLAVISARNSDQQILSALAQQDSIAILKAGPQRPRLLELIKKSGRWEDGCYVSRATQASQEVFLSLDEVPDTQADYFGMLLIRPSQREENSTLNTSPVVISFTETGKALANRLVNALDLEHWHRPEQFQARVQTAFKAGRRLAFISATGIAMRALAPVINTKYQDPAVLVLDETGQFVIPLLSGHEGGANQWAREVAELIQGQAVITSARQYLNPAWVVGMGCERNCPESVLAELFQQALSTAGLDIDQVSAITSLDLKADETGLINLSKRLNKPFICFSATQLRDVEAQLKNPSEIVFKEVGCYGVAEGSALYYAKQLAEDDQAELVLPKQKNPQATVAIARAYRGNAAENTDS